MGKNQLGRKLKRIHRHQEEEKAKKRAANLGLPYVNLTTTPLQTDSLYILPFEDARKAQLAPISRFGFKARLACLDPNSKESRRIIKEFKDKGFEIEKVVVSKSSLEKVWSAYKNLPPKKKKEIKITAQELKKFEKDISNLQDLREKISTLSTSELLQVILAGAVKTKASDIHIEPGDEQLRLRYRIDGILFDVAFLPQKIFNKLISRIKLLSDLKLNINDQPQNGRFTIQASQQEIDIRVSTLPGNYGETVVLRLLNPDIITLKLKELGLAKDHLEMIRDNLKKATGMILNTGPTGSGKTTTLYAALIKIHKPALNIITLEDPVEYRIPGLKQSQINPSEGYTFNQALKNALRQDPDVILLGEIRDQQTASSALNAALTGHRVFSTLHANSAVGAIPRLLKMGVKPFVISPALNLVIAQRLVRRVHKDCQGGGCPKCNDTGFKGRLGIFEMFEVDEEIKELILSHPSETDIKKALRQRGFRTMYEDGLNKAKKGLTTKAEVERITSS